MREETILCDIEHKNFAMRSKVVIRFCVLQPGSSVYPSNTGFYLLVKDGGWEWEKPPPKLLKKNLVSLIPVVGFRFVGSFVLRNGRVQRPHFSAVSVSIRFSCF